jgi:predicted metalloprotease with PDZ domain
VRVRRLLLTLIVLTAPAASPARAADTQVAYIVSFDTAAQRARIEATFPCDGRAGVELMMPVWSPGFYRVENYATRVRDLSAHGRDGAALAVAQPRPNRWRIDACPAAGVTVTYEVVATERSVTTNFVGEAYAVVNGAPTFITVADAGARPHDVTLVLPPAWSRTMTALPPAPDRAPNHYRAPDYETLVDSPILAGNPIVHDFTVDSAVHHLVEVGDTGAFDGARAAADLAKIVDAHRRLWGRLPFDAYYFLLAFRPGGGGLEHKASVLATTQAAATSNESSYLRWLNFISHEYCHAFNVKRLRPVELGPFDFEREPHTTSLWISEGFTSYFGEVAVSRAGLSTQDQFLASLSQKIGQLQASPGRLVQTLEQASNDVWTSESVSGVNTNAATSVSYYLKGQIVGFLLDARIRRATGGARSLDEVMRLGLARYGGARGFTPEEFRATASEVAGVDLSAWFRRAVASTDELDYADALEWYGLQFASGGWTLEARADATAAQHDRLRALFAN